MAPQQERPPSGGSWQMGVVVAAIVIGIPLLVGVISMLTLPGDT